MLHEALGSWSKWYATCSPLYIACVQAYIWYMWLVDAAKKSHKRLLCSFSVLHDLLCTATFWLRWSCPRMMLSILPIATTKIKVAGAYKVIAMIKVLKTDSTAGKLRCMFSSLKPLNQLFIWSNNIIHPLRLMLFSREKHGVHKYSAIWRREMLAPGRPVRRYVYT